jgi:uncharacterized protein (TIGR03437 family)
MRWLLSALLFLADLAHAQIAPPIYALIRRTKVSMTGCGFRATILARLFGIAFLITPAWCQAPSYTISTIAGNGKAGYSGDGGPATSAEMNVTRGIVTDPAGDVYVVDQNNNVIRKISTNGIITTVAGNGVEGYNGNNIPGTSAELAFPYRISLDAAGNLYIADEANSLIRKLAPNGILTTVAGNTSQPGSCSYSGDGGPALGAGLCYPFDAVTDALGNLYIADTLNNVIRKVDTNGIITTVAGNGVGAGELPGSYTGPGSGTGAYSGDGGPATKASLNYPVSVAVDAAGDLYIADQSNNVVRKVSATGIISTVAGHYGESGLGYSGDGGQAANASMELPAGIALDLSGNLYIADSNDNAIREVLTTGIIWTIAGDGQSGYVGDGGPATAAKLNFPRSVAVSTFGDIYIADTSNNVVRELTPSTATVGFMANAFGNERLFAANTWSLIKGTDLAPPGDSRIWQSSDFINNQMPTSLDGVSVTVNGVNAYVYYISPTQVNFLTPPNLAPGVVEVQITNGGTKSATASVLAQALSPAFFVWNGGPYVIGEHLNGTAIGPPGIVTGLNTTPVQPGETVVLFANGFGPTSSQVVSGSSTQSGNLATFPVVTIGGITASVQFAGLISPGLYQFNVVVPTNAPAGDNAITATYNGSSVQSGVLITVQ